MTERRRFRFGTFSFQTARAGVLAEAGKADALGYEVFQMADHLFQLLGAIPALMMVADSYPRLRVGTGVLCNDFHHPVVMAKDAATLDVLSEGRLELGLGAGYNPGEFEMAGIAFDQGRVRFGRLAETVQIVKRAFDGNAFSFDGAHYQVHDYTPYPVPVQRPRPPLMLGGGGRRMLSLAAAEADIVSIVPASLPGGLGRATGFTLKSVKDKVALVRDAAGDRWDGLEINILIMGGQVTTNRRAAAQQYVSQLTEQHPEFVLDGEITADDLLDSPYFAFGTHDEITEHLLRIREETGASYYSVFPHLVDPLEPVVGNLAGTA
jgi:probable F420-dependent oxidoreductase